MYKRRTGYIIRDMKKKEEWKKKLERQKQNKNKNVETVDKVVDKWKIK